MKKIKDDFRCDKCGAEVDALYFCHGKEICENCKKKFIITERAPVKEGNKACHREEFGI